jgi:hypothetical protein
MYDKVKAQNMDLTEEQFEESCLLEKQLDKMQYNEKLPSFQRKMANDAIKAIILLAEYPMVYSELYRRVIREIKEAKEYGELLVIKEVV